MSTWKYGGDIADITWRMAAWVGAYSEIDPRDIRLLYGERSAELIRLVETGRYRGSGAYCSCGWVYELLGTGIGVTGHYSHTGWVRRNAESHLAGHEGEHSERAQ